ncbi:MAG: 3D domain-containing protein [Deltaproteobacteria bacterium]|nr:3D domain-containing protein [Deltaproteobacteria bacterium]
MANVDQTVGDVPRRARHVVAAALVASLLLVLSGCAYESAAPHRPLLTWTVSPAIDSTFSSSAVEPEHEEISPTARRTRFEATAYCISGITFSGKYTKRWMVAADPDVLPIGSRIAVHNAGDYSGLYTVTDTGALIKGRKIDIYMESEREALEFGRQQVEVELFKSPPAETVAQELKPQGAGAVR